MMKYTQWIGVAAALALIASCWMNWAWYPDLKMHFTGFFSYKNYYGKPGKLLVVFSVIAMIFFIIPRLWAKRWNLLVNAVLISYAIYSFITFSRCYAASVCPEKEAGLIIMILSASLMMLMALLPEGKVMQEKQ